MVRRLALVALASVLLAPFSGLPPAARGQGEAALLPAEGAWKMRFDYRLDGELKDAKDRGGAPLRLKVDKGHITCRDGKFSFTGEVVAGKVPIINLRQDGPDGFVSFYTGKLVKKGRIVGTWYNTIDRSGDFELVLQEK